MSLQKDVASAWLGWRLADRDRERALGHLREATRRRPSWGVAWQNLARALDGAGDLAGACGAYSEAIRCGDAHDDAFARDRRLQLEMQLLARGEPVPPVPDQVRADSAAFAIVRAAAARLPSPHVFMIRPTTREISHAIIGTVVEGRALGHAIVSAGTDWLDATTLVHDGDQLGFAPARGTADDAAGPLLTWLATLDPVALTPIDAAMYVRDAVVAGLPARWTWELASYRPAALAVSDATGELRIVAAARPGGGVDLALAPVGTGAPGETLVATTPAHLLELAPAIEDATRRALAAREDFARRPFGIRHAAAQLAGISGLGEARFFERYPAWPTAWQFDATGEIAVVYLVESAAGVELTIGRDRFTARSADELAAHRPAIAAAVAADLARLRIDRLKPGDRLRVRATFGCFSPGSEVELANIAILSREGERGFTFASVRGDARLDLTEIDPAEAAMLGDIDRYLEYL